MLVNLHERRHDPARLARYGLTEVHLPGTRFPAPDTRADYGRRRHEIERGLAAGTGVAVHCRAALGRTGTLLACYFVSRGSDAESSDCAHTSIAARFRRELRPDRGH